MADLENLNKSDGYRIILMLAGTAMELPVLPERISVKQSFDSSEKKVLGLGAAADFIRKLFSRSEDTVGEAAALTAQRAYVLCP